MSITNSVRLSQARFLIYALAVGLSAAAGFFLLTLNAQAAAPTGFTSQVITDGNGDGTVDTMVVVINGGEALTACVVTAPEIAADWTYVANGIGGSIASATCDTATATITFTLTGTNAGVTGGVAMPTIAYANAVVANSIANASGNLGAVVAATIVDQAKPVFLTSTSADVDANGTVDRITVTFSETVDITDTNGAADGFTGITFSDGCTISNQDLTSNSVATKNITVTGCTAADTSITVDPTYVLAGTDMDIDDEALAPIEMANSETVAGLDGAPPAYLSSATLDNNNNGTVDFIRITYSEAVLDSSVADTDFAAGIADTTVGNLTETFTSLTPASGLVTDSANDATIYVGVASFGETISTNKTDYTLKIQQVGAITDAVPNSLASFTLKTSTDGAKPIIKSSAGRFTVDNNADGTVDYVKLVFSEPVEDGSVGGADFCLSQTSGVCVAGDLGENFTSLTPASGTETDVASDATIYVIISNGTQTTLASKTDYTLAVQMVGSVNDPTGNGAVAEGAATNSADGAAPIYVSSQTLDNDNNGTVDFIKVVYSEAVLDSSVADTDFAAGIADTTVGNLTETFTSLTPASGLVTDSANDATIYVGVASFGETISTNKTDYTLKIQQVGAITDAVPNSLASFTLKTSTDGAKPIIKSSAGRFTLDNNNDGTVDYVKLVFSESIDDGSAGNADFCASTSDGTCTAGDLTEAFLAATPSSGNETDSVASDATIYVGVSSFGQTIATKKTDYILAVQMVGSVNDASGNGAVAEGAATNSADGAKPLIKTVEIRDTNDNGLVDRIDYVWSEVVDTDDGVAPVFGDLPTTLLPDGTTAVFTGSTITDPAGASATVQVTVVAGQLAKNTAAGSTVISGDLSTKWVDNIAGTDNAAHVTGATANETVSDLAKPVIKTVEIRDTDTDGLIDRIDYVWSEVVDTDDGVAPVFGDLPTTLLPDGATAVFTGATITDPAGASATVQVTVVTGQVTLNTAAGSTAISGDLSAKWVDNISGTDNAAHATGATANETVSDLAAPLIATVSPASAATGVSADANVVITFTEAMNTTFAEGTEFSISPNPSGTQTSAFTVSDTVATLTLPTLSCGLVYTITTDEATIDAAVGTPTALDTTGPQDGDWSYTITGCGSSGGGGGGSRTVGGSITLNSPNGGQIYQADESVTVTWTGSNVSSVSLSYASVVDGSFTSIATNLTGSGSYTWVVPDISTTTASVKAEAYEGSTLLDSDSSDATFTIVGTVAPETQPTLDEQEVVGTGISPYSGLEEDINAVAVGDVIRGEHYSTVYFIDEDLKRQPFLDAQSYFTYYSSWNNVRMVTDATLGTLTMGSPMLPKAGAVLVKIVSDPRVYALQATSAGGTELRWIPSEDIAIALYGLAWADYVIDMPPTLYTQFELGDDMTDSEVVDREIMKTRLELSQ